MHKVTGSWVAIISTSFVGALACQGELPLAAVDAEAGDQASHPASLGASEAAADVAVAEYDGAQSPAAFALAHRPWLASERPSVDFLARVHEGRLVASNPIQRFDVAFGERGAQLALPTRDTGTQASASAAGGLRLGALAVGRASALVHLPDAEPTVQRCTSLPGYPISRCKQRVEAARGPIRELWDNRADGLEHSFVVAERPAGEGALSVVVAVEGAAVAVAAEGQSAQLTLNATGEQLRYERLRVWDAEGLPQNAYMQQHPAGLALIVDDEAAEYPLWIDPALSAVVWSDEGNQQSAFYGYSVASAGDVNADGYDDLIVSAPYFDANTEDTDLGGGRVSLYLGSPDGLEVEPSWFVDASLPNSQLGWSVSSAGDVNGDGYADVILGATGHSSGHSNEGAAFVHLGSASGLSQAPSWSVESNQIAALFGYSVAAAGDVNGDGYDDVIVGALSYDNGQSNEGRAWVYLGSPSGPATSAAWTAESNQAAALFGHAVAGAGDVNGDGFDDVIVGSPNFDSGQSNEGAAFVYLGSAAGLASAAAWVGQSDMAAARMGYAVASAGDVNGDGFADIIVGAPNFAAPNVDEGRAFLYHGSASGPSAAPNWQAEADQTDALFGYAVAGGGDLNADGYDDVLVGAPEFDDTLTNEGKAYAFLGGPSGVEPSANWVAVGALANARFGSSLSGIGHSNNDVWDDAVIGAEGYAGPEAYEGRATSYWGRPTVPLAVPFSGKLGRTALGLLMLAIGAAYAGSFAARRAQHTR